MLFEKQIVKKYKEQTFVRCDDTGVAKYFSAADFEGLKSTAFSFTSQQGHKLQGYFYLYDNPKEDTLVIFDHGMGGGHRSYMREIETIAKAGYMVFAYDHTGCMESGGTSTNGFAQSLNDLDCAVKAIKAEQRFKETSINVIGHSWGGYSALNIAALHPDIKHIVAISGFISVKAMVEQYFGGIMKIYGKKIYDIERKTNPKYVELDAVETLRGRNVKALVIHSAEDPVVKREKHFDVLHNALKDKENISFILTEGKFHNPNYTQSAVRYKDEFFAALTKKLKNRELETDAQKQAFTSAYDWWKMTQQDTELWNRIFEFLEE